jgi:hypothetical protein
VTLDAWRKEIRLAQKSASAGHHRTALARLGRLRRVLERAEKRRPTPSTPYHRALLHQIEAGVHTQAGEHSKARAAYLRAASVALGDLWRSLSVITPSLSLAECAAMRVGRGAGTRLTQINYLDDRGARLTSVIGDVLNEQLLAAGMPPVIFGGRYPARIAPLPEGWLRPGPYTRTDKRMGLGIEPARATARRRRPPRRSG